MVIYYNWIPNININCADDQNDLDDWINEELSGKSDAAKDLLKKMLKLDPKQRITAAEALGKCMYVA